MTRKAGNFYVPAEPKLVFVIRTKVINGPFVKLSAWGYSNLGSGNELIYKHGMAKLTSKLP